MTHLAIGRTIATILCLAKNGLLPGLAFATVLSIQSRDWFLVVMLPVIAFVLSLLIEEIEG